MVLTHKIIYNLSDLEASQLFKFSRRPGLRRPTLRFLQQTGRTRRRRNSFACRVVKYWNRLPLAVVSVRISYLSKDNQILLFTLNFALKSIFVLIWSFFGQPILSRSLNTYIHTKPIITTINFFDNLSSHSGHEVKICNKISPKGLKHARFKRISSYGNEHKDNECVFTRIADGNSLERYYRNQGLYL